MTPWLNSSAFRSADNSPTLHSAAVANADSKQQREARVYLSCASGHSPSLKEVRVETQEGIQAKSMEELLAGFTVWLTLTGSWFNSSLLQRRTIYLDNGATHSGLGSPTLINNKDNPSKT